jgi:hypothetical protein
MRNVIVRGMKKPHVAHARKKEDLYQYKQGMCNLLMFTKVDSYLTPEFW